MDPRRHLLRNGWITLAASFALVALLAIPGRASAVDIEHFVPYPSVGPIIATGSLGVTDTLLGASGNTFLSHFTFSVQPIANFTIDTTLLFQLGVSFTGAELWNGAGTTLYSTTGSPLFSGSQILAPGAYDLRISGTLTAATGLYGRSINFSPTTAPIPEPETYAMMLAGLGLMGFVARRRKQKQAA